MPHNLDFSANNCNESEAFFSNCIILSYLTRIKEFLRPFSSERLNGSGVSGGGKGTLVSFITVLMNTEMKGTLSGEEQTAAEKRPPSINGRHIFNKYGRCIKSWNVTPIKNGLVLIYREKYSFHLSGILSPPG